LSIPLAEEDRKKKKKKKKKGLRCSVKAAMELIVCFVVDYLSFTFKAFTLKICRSSFAEVSKSKSQSQVKQVQIWHILGVAGFYRNFILQKYWHLSPLQILKQKLSVYPILHFMDFDGEFILDTDAKLIRFAASPMNIKAQYWP